MAICCVRGCEKGAKMEFAIPGLGSTYAVCNEHMDEAVEIIAEIEANLQTHLSLLGISLFRKLRNIRRDEPRKEYAGGAGKGAY